MKLYWVRKKEGVIRSTKPHLGEPRDQLLPVVPHRIHLYRNRVRNHLSFRIRNQNPPHIIRRKRIPRQPNLFILPLQNHRHPGMDRSKYLIGRSRNDRIGQDLPAIQILPGIVQPREPKELLIRSAEEIRLLPAFGLFPFIEPVRRNDAPVPGQERTEHRLFKEGFRSRINGFLRSFQILCPVRDDAPPHHLYPVPLSCCNDNRVFGIGGRC